MFFGIDLGTTNSTISYWIQTGEKRFDIRTIRNSNGQPLTPSIVLFEKETGKVIVGKRAYDEYENESERAIRWVKRSMGTDYKFKIDGQEYLPQVISAYILKELKKFAERDLQLSNDKTIQKIVITVPADFDTNAKQATLDAAKIAGFVDVELIDEPNAAVLNYIFRSQEIGKYDGQLSKDKKFFVVFDLGGGTFDVSLSELSIDMQGKPNTSVIASAGDKYLGGANFDNSLMLLVINKAKKLYSANFAELNQLYEQAEQLVQNKKISQDEIIRDTLARLSMECETGKIALTEESKKVFNFFYKSSRPYRIEISREEFEQVVLIPYTKRIEKLIDQVLIDSINKNKINNWTDLEGVILVGGSTNIPKIRSLCEDIFGKKVIQGVDTFESVAKGAAIYSSMKSGNSDIVGTYSNIVPHTIGVFSGGIFNPVLLRGSDDMEISINYEIPFSLDTSTPIEVMQEYRSEEGENILLPIERLNYSHPFIYTGDNLDITFFLDDNLVLTVQVKEKCVYDSVEMKIENPVRINDKDLEAFKKLVNKN